MAKKRLYKRRSPKRTVEIFTKASDLKKIKKEKFISLVNSKIAAFEQENDKTVTARLRMAEDGTVELYRTFTGKAITPGLVGKPMRDGKYLDFNIYAILNSSLSAVKKRVKNETNSLGNGGPVIGSSHKDGGVPCKVIDQNNRPVEIEGKEYFLSTELMDDPIHRTHKGTPHAIFENMIVLSGGDIEPIKGKCELRTGDHIITKPALIDTTSEYTITGTNKQVASALNTIYGGVEFAPGAMVIEAHIGDLDAAAVGEAMLEVLETTQCSEKAAAGLAIKKLNDKKMLLPPTKAIKKDPFRAFKKIVHDSPNVEVAYNLARKVEDISPYAAKRFMDKYNASNRFTRKQAFGRFYWDIKYKQYMKEARGSNKILGFTEFKAKELAPAAVEPIKKADGGGAYSYRVLKGGTPLHIGELSELEANTLAGEYKGMGHTDIRVEPYAGGGEIMAKIHENEVDNLQIAIEFKQRIIKYPTYIEYGEDEKGKYAVLIPKGGPTYAGGGGLKTQNFYSREDLGKDFLKNGIKYTFSHHIPKVRRQRGGWSPPKWVYSFPIEENVSIEEVSIKEVAENVAKELNGKLIHVSSSGSRYIILPNYKTIRISDHWIQDRDPMNPISRADYEIVQKYYTKNSAKEIIKDINEEQSGSSTYAGGGEVGDWVSHATGNARGEIYKKEADLIWLQDEYGNRETKAFNKKYFKKSKRPVLDEANLATGGEIDKFIDYVASFYAEEYNGGFTKEQIREAVNKYKADPNTNWGGGDSMDRELMRDKYLEPLFAEGGGVSGEINYNKEDVLKYIQHVNSIKENRNKLRELSGNDKLTEGMQEVIDYLESMIVRNEKGESIGIKKYQSPQEWKAKPPVTDFSPQSDTYPTGEKIELGDYVRMGMDPTGYVTLSGEPKSGFIRARKRHGDGKKLILPISQLVFVHRAGELFNQGGPLDGTLFATGGGPAMNLNKKAQAILDESIERFNNSSKEEKKKLIEQVRVGVNERWPNIIEQGKDDNFYKGYVENMTNMLSAGRVFLEIVGEESEESSSDTKSTVPLNIKQKKTAFNYVYDRLLKVAPDLLKLLEKAQSPSEVYGQSQYRTSDFGGNDSFMYLSIEGLEKDDKGRYILSISHYYKQEGDMMCDPCMTVRLDPELQTVEALSFRMDGFVGGGHTKEVCGTTPEGKEGVNIAEKKSQNSFLNMWSNNWVKQGHKVEFNELDEEDNKPVRENDTDYLEFNKGDKVKVIGLGDIDSPYNDMIGTVVNSQWEDINVSFSDMDDIGHGFLPKNLVKVEDGGNTDIAEFVSETTGNNIFIDLNELSPTKDWRFISLDSLSSALRSKYVKDRFSPVDKNSLDKISAIHKKYGEDALSLGDDSAFTVAGAYLFEWNVEKLKDENGSIRQKIIENRNWLDTKSSNKERLEEIAANSDNIILATVPKPEEIIDKPEPAPANVDIFSGMDQEEVTNTIKGWIDEKGLNRSKYSAQELQAIRMYEGMGSLAKKGYSDREVLDQFFTPDLIVKQMWNLAVEAGFDLSKNNDILEPAVGTGRFLEYIAKDQLTGKYKGTVDAYEIDRYAHAVCKLSFPEFNIVHDSFESLFFRGKQHLGLMGIKKKYDLVIGNPPYREYRSELSNLGEKKETGAVTFDQYMMMRGVDLLKPGGLLVFIIPSTFLRNKTKYNEFKDVLDKKAETKGAWRLPNAVFENTTVGTDILILKKR